MTRAKIYRMADSAAWVGAVAYFVVWFGIFGFALVQSLRGRL